MFDQLSQIKPIAPAGEATAEDHGAVLAELRRQVDEVRQALGGAMARGATQVNEGINEGADQLATAIRKSPGLALGLAVIAGALVAVAVTQQRRPRSMVEKAGDSYRRAMSELDGAKLLARLEQTAASARDRASGLVPTIENLAQSLSRMEPGAMQPIVDKGTAWARSLWDVIGARTGVVK